MISSIHNIYNILYQLVQKPKFTLGIYVFKCGSSQKLSLGLDWVPTAVTYIATQLSQTELLSLKTKLIDPAISGLLR